MTTWDFRGLSSLPAGWSRRGVASETFDASGMQASYTAGQAHYFTLASTAAGGTLEVKIVSGTLNAHMIGPQLFSASSTRGACTAWYTGPANALILALGSSRQYSGTFDNLGGTPAYPVWFRVRYSGATAYGSFSTDGTTWSAEQDVSSTISGGVDEIAFGSILGSGTAKIEYVKWTLEGATEGTLDATLPLLEASFSGTYAPPPITGSLSATLPLTGAAFTGTYQAPPSGTMAADLPLLQAGFTGTYTAPSEQTGTLDATLPLTEAAFTGTYVPPDVTGSLAATLPLITASFTGSTSEAEGSLDATLPLLVAAFEGTYGGPYPTDTANDANGRGRRGLATVTITRPVAAVPDTLTLATRVDKAIAYPTPDMVDGRPT